MTFHVRLVSVPDRTHDLVEALAADAGVSNLLVLSGVARGPASDAIQFDVQPRSANSVFRNLQAFQHDHGGTVTVLIAMGALVLRAQRIIWRSRERAERSRDVPSLANHLPRQRRSGDG